MRKLRVFVVMAAVAVLGACSGGSDNTLVGGTGTGGSGGPPAAIGSLTLLTSSPQIPSDGSADATISALVRDSNNNVMPNVSVVFSADAGSLVVSQPATTDSNGVVTAALSTGGDPTNRPITVSATSGGINQSVTVDVAGTDLQINGPSSLPLGTDGNFTVVLTDAGGKGIANKQVEIASANGNGVSASPITTDALGHGSFTLSATAAGNETLTATALGIQATHAVSVSSDVFSFTTPAADTEIALGNNQTVTVNWQQSGAGVANRQVDFSTTRGTFSAATVMTDSSGNATVTLSANNAGPALVTATNADGTSIQLDVEFVATTPTSVELQANPFSVPTGGQSAITAVVRDANGNLVKNQTVNFVLNDVTGGSLSVAQAVTNSQGRAQTFYNASSTTSAVDGVTVDAAVQGFPSVTDSVSLTVAQRELYISLGTGNQIVKENSAQYKKTWVVQVTDAQGNGVKGVDLSISVLSDVYFEGAYPDPAPGAKAWDPPVIAGSCPDEDVNRNGVLDAGEDANNNGKIEAGNIATAVAEGTGGGTVTTDANGFALIDVLWPQNYSNWLEVTLEARTSVQGTASSASTTFVLPVLADDVSDVNVSPPGRYSPFGTDGDCATPPPPDGP